MPELPDITVYLEALERRIIGHVLEQIRLLDLFVLRTAMPPIDSLFKRRVSGLRRLGKRIAIGFEGDRWLVIHLMIAGRLQWTDPTRKSAARNVLAELRFDSGILALTEAGTKRRASMHVVDGKAGLAAHDRGGMDVLSASLDEFSKMLTRRITP